jgi:sec-independent protein translocase protein TatA
MGLINDIGGGEILIVLLAVLVLFGSKGLPNFARTLGKGLNEVRKATDEIKREINDQVKDIGNETKDFKDKMNS